MKYFRFLFAVAAASLCLASCGSKNEPLSAGKIKGLASNYLAENNGNVETKSLKIGYFESSSKEINFYKKLEKLGIVTCEVQNFQWYTRVTKNTYHNDYITEYYYEGTDELAYSRKHYGISPVVTDYILDYHYMINVRLTKKGEGMVLKKAEEEPANDQPQYDVKKFPMDTLVMFSSEDIIAAPALPVPEVRKEYIKDNRKPVAPKEEKVVKTPAPKKEAEPRKAVVRYPLYESMDPATESAFNAAKEKESSEKVDIIVAEYKVSEVKDRVVEKDKETGELLSMEANVILKTCGITEATHLIALYLSGDILLNDQTHNMIINVVNNWAKGKIDEPEWSVESLR